MFTATLNMLELGHIGPNHRFAEFTDFILVHNAQEAEGFPDNVIAAWPDENLVPSLFAGIYWAVNRTEQELRVQHLDAGSWIYRQACPIVSLEQFGLTYPLTSADLVDNWRKVDELWFALTQGERSVIISHITRGDPLPTSNDNNDE